MPKSVFIIAEAGINHNGDVLRAKDMVDAAVDAGADAIKFQIFRAELLSTARSKMAAYQVNNTSREMPQRDMLRELELSEDDFENLSSYCRDKNLKFMASAFDAPSCHFVSKIGVPALKIPSGDITAGELILQVARLGLPIILSTGMSSLGEIEEALSVIAFGLVRSGLPRQRSELLEAYSSDEGRSALKSTVTLMHCVTNYPASTSSVNLRAIRTMQSAFKLDVGYSDHTLGSEVALGAVALGATVIEKHFTLNRGLPGPDHAASLEPLELAHMVKSIRNIESALGNGVKCPTDEELPNVMVARRSLVAAKEIKKGQVISAGDICSKRPGDGLSPMLFWDIVGTIATRNYHIDEQLRSD